MGRAREEDKRRRKRQRFYEHCVRRGKKQSASRRIEAAPACSVVKYVDVATQTRDYVDASTQTFDGGNGVSSDMHNATGIGDVTDTGNVPNHTGNVITDACDVNADTGDVPNPDIVTIDTGNVTTDKRDVTDTDNVPNHTDNVPNHTDIVTTDKRDVTDTDIVTIHKRDVTTDTGNVPTDTSEVTTDKRDVNADTGDVPNPDIVTIDKRDVTDTDNVPNHTGDVPTDTSDVPTDTGNVTADTGEVSTDKRDVTDTGIVTTDTGNVTADTGNVTPREVPNPRPPLSPRAFLNKMLKPPTFSSYDPYYLRVKPPINVPYSKVELQLMWKYGKSLRSDCRGLGVWEIFSEKMMCYRSASSYYQKYWGFVSEWFDGGPPRREEVKAFLRGILHQYRCYPNAPQAQNWAALNRRRYR